MKTAEDWFQETLRLMKLTPDEYANVNTKDSKVIEYCKFIQSIQLDAMKEGARRAASKVSHAQHKQFALGGAPTLIEARENFVEVIRTTAEQWTEKDL